ncbi:Universal stress protein, UspA [Nitrosococcus oceani ATCC 19707]|uniref:Universal stress protein, UspA n=2 Tax=Nitrosococcus oceani TaxID=1229 RepID=Q3J926_NITOC|nr:universal stress protein [Nitrosococcus oceani]ABA58670.1 Universal stress protein, UspA [Nitrosococcus oceani ATCC 19707]EDZ67185.1 universal stress protein family, putative [Nitrosococcus oceani AFC27]KFI18971.1 universal stress protein UspA [Nitrosococcus oceani C-27]GEM19791.1 universal stress protein UspA [Nitrosococcus oceani]
MSAEFKIIIVPIDGSESSQRAARFGDSLAKATGRKMRFLYVFPATPNEVVGMSQLSREDIERAKEESARRALDKAHRAIGDPEREIEEQVLFGDPAEEIIRYIDYLAEQSEQPLVVMGRRGLSRIESLLLGSVSEKVIRYANGAVTIVQ